MFLRFKVICERTNSRDYNETVFVLCMCCVSSWKIVDAFLIGFLLVKDSCTGHICRSISFWFGSSAMPQVNRSVGWTEAWKTSEGAISNLAKGLPSPQSPGPFGLLSNFTGLSQQTACAIHPPRALWYDSDLSIARWLSSKLRKKYDVGFRWRSEGERKERVRKCSVPIVHPDFRLQVRIKS